MVNKGRKPVGYRPGCNNLSLSFAEEVRAHRLQHPEKTQRAIARDFKSSPTNLSRILKNQIWKTPEGV